jgi:signal transduction histidine kinase
MWLLASTVLCVGLQRVSLHLSAKAVQRSFHKFLASYFAAVGLLSFWSLVAQVGTVTGSFGETSSGKTELWMSIGLTFSWVLPLAAVVYSIVRYRALGIGSQKNLIYSVSIAFLAVLYLSVVRRASGWMEPYFPPEATAAFLLFILLAFFEPLQRLASRLLRRGFQEQVDRLQRLSAELQREALRGESGRLIEFAEEHIRQEFGLELVRIHLSLPAVNTGRHIGDGAPSSRTIDERRPADVAAARPAWAGQPVRLRLGKPGAEMGELEVVPIGSAISGEASAALDFLAEQLPAVIELCRVIEQKVALERKLDERERMALVGQMAASISHNLKNPLGSMKTILQVQLENSELPAAARRDLAMVLGELDRLSVKLNQLLQFARPAVRATGAAPSRVDVGAVAEQLVSLSRHDSERRRVRLTLNDVSGGAFLAGSEEALADILSNLVVNAIEAVTDGGAVTVGIACEAQNVVLTVSDDGLGIPAANRANVFQPFFTTKPSGTGLGLAIVARRVAELGGSVVSESPVAEGRGARFVVRLPIAGTKKIDGKEE